MPKNRWTWLVCAEKDEVAELRDEERKVADGAKQHEGGTTDQPRLWESNRKAHGACIKQHKRFAYNRLNWGICGAANSVLDAYSPCSHFLAVLRSAPCRNLSDDEAMPL